MKLITTYFFTKPIKCNVPMHIPGLLVNWYSNQTM